MILWNARNLTPLLLFALVFAVSASAQEPSRIPLLEAFEQSVPAPPESRGDTLIVTFDQAMALIFQSNPVLREARSRAAAGHGFLRQAGLYPNPEIGVEVDELARRSAGGPSQTTIALSQTIPLSGRRGAEQQQAEHELSAATADVSRVMLDLYREASSAFAALLGAQQNVDNARERLRLAQEIARVVGVKVNEGAVPKSEHLQARAAAALAEVDALTAESDRLSAQSALASLWTDNARHPLEAIGDLDMAAELPPEDTLYSHLGQNPELVALRATVHAREAELGLARAVGRPEPTIGIGYRRLHHDADNALVASVSLPIPFFDRNQGNVQAQTAKIGEAQAALKSAELRLNGMARNVWTQFISRSSEITALEERVLPDIQQSLQEIDEAYRLGRQPYINVLDAQRTLAEIQLRLVEAKVGRAQATAKIEQLTGHRLNPVRR
jgi:cobalt-zinc-cadmium efflux system outer membrane protein